MFCGIVLAMVFVNKENDQTTRKLTPGQQHRLSRMVSRLETQIVQDPKNEENTADIARADDVVGIIAYRNHGYGNQARVEKSEIIISDSHGELQLSGTVRDIPEDGLGAPAEVHEMAPVEIYDAVKQFAKWQ